MVLQRNVPIRLRGTCEPGKYVKITMTPVTAKKPKGVTRYASADQDGIWEAILPARPASGPYSIAISGSGQDETVFTDVMIGDVWMCSGQSNMEMPIYSERSWWRDQDYETLFAEAKDFPQIRVLKACPQKHVSP